MSTSDLASVPAVTDAAEIGFTIAAMLQTIARVREQDFTAKVTQSCQMNAELSQPFIDLLLAQWNAFDFNPDYTVLDYTIEKLPDGVTHNLTVEVRPPTRH